jgi:hypothetical protein
MCNCGNKRNEVAATPSFKLSKQHFEPQKNSMWPDAYFEYIGKTGLTVTGNISGKQYRFNGQGDKQMVDYRDASGMMKVPVLKRSSG